MTALTERIAEVLQYALEEHGLDDMGLSTQWTAGLIEDELQLTEECGYQIDGERPDEPDAWFPASDYKTSRPVTHRRWVSGWTAADSQPQEDT